MQKLKGSQRKYLRGLAHGLKPVVIVGRSGLSGTVLESIDQALGDHELIKIRFGDFQDQRKAFTQEIEAKLTCECVGMVGHVAICYRPAAEQGDRQIRLPQSSSADQNE